MIFLFFIHVKLIKVISGFNLKNWKNFARWRCHAEISKMNIKMRISPLLICPQGPQRSQKKRHDPLNMLLEVWCAKNGPKLKKIPKTFKKQAFLMSFSSILMVFCSLFSFGSILAHHTFCGMFSEWCCFIWHPLGPWGRVNSGEKGFSGQTATVLSLGVIST